MYSFRYFHTPICLLLIANRNLTNYSLIINQYNRFYQSKIFSIDNAGIYDGFFGIEFIF
jgi:hypothetical protein